MPTSLPPTRSPRENDTKSSSTTLRRTLAGEEVERRAQEVGLHPAVRQIAEEADLAHVAAPHLGPLIPRRGPPIAEQPAGELDRRVALAQAHQAADDAPFVRRVRVPRRSAGTPALPGLIQIASEGAPHRRLRQAREQVAGGEGDGARR